MLLLLTLKIIMHLVKKKLIFKDNAPFIGCNSKFNGVLIDNAEDLDVVMPMYNLLQHSKKYSKTTGSLWNYHRAEPNSDVNGGVNGGIIDYKTSFIEGSLTQNNLIENDVEIAVPLKHLGNFWKTLDMPLINCEIELILNWSKNCVLRQQERQQERQKQQERQIIMPIL